MPIEKRKTSVMNEPEFFRALSEADSVAAVETALQDFERDTSLARWTPVGGRENNRGTIDSAADPGRSVVERLTNGIDAILEYQHDTHHGRPDCRTPKDAASSWLNVPGGGLSEMTPTQRRALAQNVTVKVLAGEGKAARIIEARDRGIGLTTEEMPRTILSLNESNKMQKHYLAGAYGQGGSSTFASSKYTLIASRKETSSTVGFTVVKFEDLPPEEYKIGRYVYLTTGGQCFGLNPAEANDFPRGTLIKHFGYDLTNYSASIGPTSLYGLLNQTLFDQVLPIWLDDHAVHNYRRVIKGSRNALNGATDEGDAHAQGPTLSHKVRLFYSSIGDFGRIGIEYWVLEPPTTTNKKPSAVFVNPNKPIILTLNGQNQAEMTQLLIKKSAELPYLALRLICHIDCNSLSPTAKRALFVSTRENARHGLVQEFIQQEIIAVLRSDDELTRLNREARDQGLRERDETAEHEMRREVARLLQLQGVPVDVGTVQARTRGTGEVAIPSPPRPRPPRPPAPPIALQEPPTFIRFVVNDDEEINFHPQQRRYIRIETDANSNYHHPTDPLQSRINVISTTSGVTVRGSTALEGGRMRAIFEAATGAVIGNSGTIRVELSRPGLPMLSDSRACRVITPPPTRQESQEITLPPFIPIPLSPEHDQWTALNWPEDIGAVASEAQMDHGTLNIYYSTVFPKYAAQRAVFERRNLALAESFTKRYEIWIAVHSLLLHREEENSQGDDIGAEQAEQLLQGSERHERCRVGTLSAMFAAREVEISANAVADTD